jgi:hypothetical protein
MGLGDDYELPSNYNEAYGVVGDGVAVPAVRHLAEHVLEPVLRASTQPKEPVHEYSAVTPATPTPQGVGCSRRR